MKTRWKPNSAIKSDWEEDSGGRTGKITTIRKWAHDETRMLYTVEQMTKQLAMINIEDHMGYLPSNIHKIIQAAYQSPEHHGVHKTERVSEWVSKNNHTGCEITIKKTCPSCHKPCNPKTCPCPESIIEYEYEPNLYDKAAHPEWYPKVTGLGLYNIGRIGEHKVHGDYPYYRLMKPRTNSFFNVNAHIKGCVNFDVTSKVTYEVDDLSSIELNIKKSKVLLSYLGYRIDDEGYNMIPDIPEVWTSIRHYIDMKLSYGQWARTADGKYERMYFQMKRIYDEAHDIARKKLARIEPERLKAIWDNMIGKKIPHYYAEETFYESVDDTYRHIT
jgi:hypothetical protein